MSYYETSQWPAGGQAGWDHQTPPVRSGASSAVPREESTAFVSQLEEVDKAIDNLLKSGKMFGMSSGRRESLPASPYMAGPPRKPRPDFDGRMGSGPGPRPHSVNDFSGGHQGSNLSNFYASQRHHQPSRGSNEAEQMMQAKRRMAAQRERELRNYHQEQQYNRTVLSDVSSTYTKPERALSPGNMSEDERRELIARQRSALYEGTYVDENGNVRPGVAGTLHGPGNAALRGHSPLAYEYGGRGAPPVNSDAPATAGTAAVGNVQTPVMTEGPPPPTVIASERVRANSSSPQSNPGVGAGGGKSGGGFEASQQATRTTNSSPGGSPGSGKPPASGAAVAPIGTRPSASAASLTSSPANSAALGNKQQQHQQQSAAAARLPSPLGHGYSSPGNGEDKQQGVAGNAAVSQPSTPADGSVPALSGWGGGRPGVWGNKSGLGSVQASVWG